MKTILLLPDEAAPPTQLLQDVVAAKMPFRETETVPGCNCDRWGHPCPSCVEPKSQTQLGLPISLPAKQLTETRQCAISRP
jgi:hypothetical protein